MTVNLSNAVSSASIKANNASETHSEREKAAYFLQKQIVDLYQERNGMA
jgi:hypothetical protein